MFKLSIAIPNYERINKMTMLVKEIVSQIRGKKIQDKVEICISDDCSKDDPTEVIEGIKKDYPEVFIKYSRNTENKGMDFNFWNSVMLSDSEYCWIIGNDDLPERDGVEKILTLLESKESIDFILTPFDVYSNIGEYRSTINPLSYNKDIFLDTSIQKELNNLIMSVTHNSGLFAFLSNVVFRKKIWDERWEKFKDKFDSIFIQMYINISKLKEGCHFYYYNKKIIRNTADDEMNYSANRISRILLGLDGIVEYFFTGDEKDYLKHVLTDAYISELVWNIEDNNPYKKRIENIVSEKNKKYKAKFVKKNNIKTKLNNKKIMIFGAGTYGKKALAMLENEGINVLGVCDSDKNKVGELIEGHAIVGIDSALEKYKNEDVCFVVANHEHLVEMVSKVENAGITRIAIIT